VLESNQNLKIEVVDSPSRSIKQLAINKEKPPVSLAEI